MADEQTIRVIRPDGKFSTIPSSSLSLAVKRGYKPAPQLKGTPPSVPEELQGQNPYAVRLEQYLDENVKGMSEMPDEMLKRSREIYLQEKAKGGWRSKFAIAQGPLQSIDEQLLAIAQGILSLTPPGIINRMQNKEDPAKTAADATMFLVGQMAGGEKANKVLETGAKPLAKGLEKTASGARILSQEISGAGKEPVVKAARARQMEIEKAQAKHAGATEEALKHHQDTVGSVERSNAEAQAKHAEAEAAARQKWVQKAYEAKQGKTQAAKVAARKETLTRSSEAYTKILKQNIDAAHEAVRSALGARWNALRDTIGKATELNSFKINNAVEMAKQRFLMGAPESLKVFNDLMKQMQVEGDNIDVAGGKTAPGLRPLTWDEGRVHYSALQEKLYSGELPGNVSRALRYVTDTLDTELSKVAKDKGAGETYSKLKSDWSQYMDDWKDMGSLATGGSPLARALLAKDPAFVSSQVLGKAGERMMQMSARYQQYGLSPRLMSRIRGMQAELKSLPKVKVPSEPAPYEPPGAPKLKTAPEMKEIPAPKEPAPIDPAAIRRQRLEEFAGRPFRFYDLFPPYLIEHMMMKSPAFREWVASQPRQELKP